MKKCKNITFCHFFAFGGPCDVQKRVKVYKVYVSWKPWLYSLRRHQKKWFLSNWGRTRCNRSAQGLKMANCTSFKILTQILFMWNISWCGNFRPFQTKWHRCKSKNMQIFCLFCTRTYSGCRECTIGRPTVPRVYSWLHALYIKLREHMQRPSDCSSIVHVYICTDGTANVTAVSWVNKSLAHFTGHDNPRN